MDSSNLKDTKIKISVTQDGLLPEETSELATFPFPALDKKLLAALGFEKVDTSTYVGVLPVFINLSAKGQEVEVELGVDIPELRKQVIGMLGTTPKKPEAKKSSSRAKKTGSNVIKLGKGKQAAKAAKAAKPAQKTAPKNTKKTT